MKNAQQTGFVRCLESLAPFVAGLLLFGCGLLAAMDLLKPGHFPAGPMQGSTLTTSLLVAGAGLAIFLASWEMLRLRRAMNLARQDTQRAVAERELALLQARRMRAQTDGLALMREIHRSTAIPERNDRLHRILTLVGDLFDAQEVTLFAAGASFSRPVAYMSATTEEEVFVSFEDEAFDLCGQQPKPFKNVRAQDSNMACEGSWLYCEGNLWLGEAPIARAQWRRTLASQEGAPPRQNGNQMLEGLLSRVDHSPAALRDVARALEQRRTLRKQESEEPYLGNESMLILSVPLMADQRGVGVLRIRRQSEGFDGPVAEALEETLIESAKHIALAMKKDEDDRKAITDQLTGLFIKRHFLSMLEQLRTQAASAMSDRERNFGLVLCDIDHFKKVNDTHGHLSGDIILKNVSRVLRGGLRAGDLAFRYGGEEIAILMPGASQEAAQQTADRLRSAIETSDFKGDKGQSIPITISMGVARNQPGLSGEGLISRADQALYASKHNGRNRVTCWSKELPDPLQKKKSKRISKKVAKAAVVKA